MHRHLEQLAAHAGQHVVGQNRVDHAPAALHQKVPKPLLPRSAALGFDPEVPVANQLSRRSFWIAFAIVLGLFLFLGGPVWRDPFNIDRQIIGSYLPIPILVAALLAVEKKLRAMPWFLATMELTALKFAVTYTIAIGLWMVSGEPKKREAFVPPEQVVAEPAKPSPTVFAPDSLGSMQGVVVSDTGSPVPGALVYASHGMERFSFSPPDRPARLTLNKNGVLPEVLTVRAFQTLEIASGDRQLHTALGVDTQGRSRFNFPAVASGEAKPARAPSRLWTANCRVLGASRRAARNHGCFRPSVCVGDRSRMARSFGKTCQAGTLLYERFIRAWPGRRK